jgi:putative hemolysin
MVAGVFRLGDRRAASLMTPRPEITWLDVEDPPDENRRKILEYDHSYLPVGRGSLDDLLGVVRAKTLLRRSLAGEPFDLQAALEPPLYVPELMPALQVMEVFRKGPMQMALVIDEYGGVQGVVTIHDILETIAGDFPSSDEAEEPEVIQRADGSWLLDGMLPVDEFNELFRPARLPGQEKGEFQTLGGFVMKTLGRIPTSGDRFEVQGLRFEVVDMDGFRVDKVLVVPAPAPGRETGSG